MKELIIKYINNLSKEDITNYLYNENIILNDYELNFIYNLLKNEYELFFNNREYFFNKLKNNINYNNYLKLISLYNKYEKYL